MTQPTERTALVVTIKQAVHQVYVRESTAVAIEAAEHLLREDNRPQHVEHMRVCLLRDGYFEYENEDCLVTAFHIAPAYLD